MQCNEIGTKVTKQEFVNFLNSVRGGQFFHVQGYTNAEGEKADHWLRFGIKYDNLKRRDVTLLQDALAGTKAFEVKVTHGAWVPNDLLSDQTMFASYPSSGLVWAKVARTVVDQTSGASIKVESEGMVDLLDVVKFGNRKSADRTAVTLSYTLASTHPLVISAIGASDLQGTVLQGLINPVQKGAEYDKEAQSCYSLEKEGCPDRWYLRDILAVQKVVRVKGNYKFSASFPINAVKDAIRSKVLLTGKYRQFILTDGQFESITIEGQAILVDGIDEELYFALPDYVKAAMVEPAVAELT